MRVSTHPTDTEAPLIVERSPEEKRRWWRSLWIVAVSASASIGVLLTILFQDPS